MELSYMGGGKVLSPHLLLLDGDRSSTDLQPENIAASSDFSRWLLVASRCFHSRGRHVPDLGRSGTLVQSSSIANNCLIYCRRERPGDKGAQGRTARAEAPAVPVTLERTLPCKPTGVGTTASSKPLTRASVKAWPDMNSKR